MKESLVLLACCLAVAVPLGLALLSQARHAGSSDTGRARASDENLTAESEIVETIEALAAALRARGDETTAERLLDAYYGAATGTELVMAVRFVLQTIDRRALYGDVALLIKAERLLALQ